MSIMYLAKVNLTTGIFDVYDEKLKIGDVTKLIYDEMDVSNEYKTQTRAAFRDPYGNKKREFQRSVYQFSELNKQDDMVVTGRLVRTFDKPTEYINPAGKVSKKINQESASIYFYFDTKNELIAFSERQSFGYNQFTRAFNYLLNLNSKGYRFEIFLQKDKEVLQEKIRGLKQVKNVKATLIPPNSNEVDMQEIRKAFPYIDDCKSVNANRIKIEMSVDDEINSLKMEAKYMQGILKAVTLGYGDVTTLGINNDGKKQIISSNQDAALTRVINENLNQYDYNEEAKSFIGDFLRKREIKNDK